MKTELGIYIKVLKKLGYRHEHEWVIALNDLPNPLALTISATESIKLERPQTILLHYNYETGMVFKSECDIKKINNIVWSSELFGEVDNTIKIELRDNNIDKILE